MVILEGAKVINGTHRLCGGELKEHFEMGM
jgi:hypothetical protein